MNFNRTILTGAVLLAVTAAATPAKAASVDLVLGTLASLGTPYGGVIGNPSTYSAEFAVYEYAPGNIIEPSYQGVGGGAGVVRADGTPDSLTDYSPTGASNLTWGFSFAPANSGTFTAWGSGTNYGVAPGTNYVVDAITSASLYQGSSLIESASLAQLSGGQSNYSFDPIDVLAGTNYTMDIVGSAGAWGYNSVVGQINIASAAPRSAVPLPASFPLFATAILGLMGFAAMKRVRER